MNSRLDAVAAAVEARHRARTPASRELYRRAGRALAGGTTGNLRHFPPYPIYFAGGDGAHTTDVDGNWYLDCFLCNGPLLLGHRPAEVLAAIDDHRGIGSLVVNPELAVRVAEALQRILPGAERVRFLNSGTEAVLTATRIARAFTGRERIVKFLGHYHGQDDQFLIGVGPQPDPFGAGVPRTACAATELLPYGDVDALERALRRRDVAAVLLDPAMHAGGLWGSDRAYLRAARDLCEEHQTLLIFDEVITGFRLGLRGAQGLHDVTPDLTVLGKALAAGEKLAAVAGREDVMAVVDPSRPGGALAFQSGTANDGTVALAAALGALAAYERLDGEGRYTEITGLAGRLAGGLRDELGRRTVPAVVHQHGPMLQLFLTSAADTFAGLAGADPAARTLFLLALASEGLLLTLPTSDHVYLSFAHTSEHIEDALAAVGRVLDTHPWPELVAAPAT